MCGNLHMQFYTLSFSFPFTLLLKIFSFGVSNQPYTLRLYPCLGF